MKISKEQSDQIDQAMDDLATIPYFPQADNVRAAVMDNLLRFVAGPEEFLWLVRTTVATAKQWCGVAEMRALYCTRYRPVDGLKPEPQCALPGFTPSDLEAEYTRSIARPQRYLPKPEDTPMTPEEIEQWNKLIDRKLSLAMITKQDAERQYRK